MPDSVPTLRSRRAMAVRHHGVDSQQAIDAARELAAANLERYVDEVVAKAPPLTIEQLDRITAILRGGA